MKKPCLVDAGSTFEEAQGALDDRPSDLRFDQYYTRPDVAAQFYDIFRERYDPDAYQMVEPSAGDGAFFRLLPASGLGYDVEPKWPGIKKADFLELEVRNDRDVAFIGNPPFGKNASTAIRFFNHAARWARVIALILPRTFRKGSVENRLDPHFHLVREEEVEAGAFLFRGKPYDVPALFQIWERRDEPRWPRRIQVEHPHFEFTTREKADFAIQRVGARAGRVHHDLHLSASAHYFIRGDVEAVMRQLDFSRFVGDVAGNPSLSKSEIILLYREHRRRQAAARRQRLSYRFVRFLRTLLSL